MATSHFFIQPDQRNTNLVNTSNEIRTEPSKTRGRKPGSKTNQPNQKKQRLRGMGVAYLERLRIEEEKKQMMPNPNPNPNQTLLPVPDPVVVLQGFPSYGGSTKNRLYCGGGGVWSGPIMIDPVVCSPCGFVETNAHELSSIPNPQVYNHPCDTCFFKKKRFERDHLLQQDPRTKTQSDFFYDHIIDRSSTNHTGLKQEYGSYIEGNPSNGSGGVKEYEFFPGKCDDFLGKSGEIVSVATPVGEYSPNSSTIDLSLKL